MTNYEWLVKNKAELVKKILSHGLSKEEGIPSSCSNTQCINCDFHGDDCVFCSVNTAEWLEAEHEPLYKKGDIVVGPFNQIFFVKKDYDYDDSIMISSYTDDTCGKRIPITDIKKKIGHIEESEV